MTCLVDTSIWIEHFRSNNQYLRELLEAGDVVIHDLIIGELACGNLKQRQLTLKLLEKLPRVTNATHKEVLYLIEQKKLMGLGLGIIDFHLLTCAKISQIKLFTADKKLKDAANLLDVAQPLH